MQLFGNNMNEIVWRTRGSEIPGQFRFSISKGRYGARSTSKVLEKLGLPYFIVVEPQETDLYAQNIDREKIPTLPFKSLGQGSIPARNWVWEHSILQGHERHWILDDNI
jgi:hypothetical protein